MSYKAKVITLVITMVSIVLILAFFGELIAKILAGAVALLMFLGVIALFMSGDSKSSSSSGFIMGYIFGSKK